MSEDRAEYGIRPMPCVRIGDQPVNEMPIKKHFAKINEELDELKNAITYCDAWYMNIGDSAKMIAEMKKDKAVDLDEIAEEAADTITAITTMLEAIGIDEKMRDEVQRRVNEKNRERGRL